MGLVSEDTPGFDNYMGYGRVNAYQAILGAAAGVDLFADEFEGGGPEWTESVLAQGHLGGWHLTMQRNHSMPGSLSWKCGAVADSAAYAESLDVALISPPVVLTADTELKFWHYMDAHIDTLTSAALDGGRVEITDDLGASWKTLTPTAGYSHIWGSTDNAFLSGEPVFSGTQGWSFVTIDLGSYQNKIVRVRFHFASRDSIAETELREGWYIDDVRIEPKAPSDVPGVAIAPVAPLELSPAFPNPFHDRASMRLRLEAATEIRIEVIDVSGRRLYEHALGRMQAGEHHVQLDPRAWADRARPRCAGRRLLHQDLGRRHLRRATPGLTCHNRRPSQLQQPQDQILRRDARARNQRALFLTQNAEDAVVDQDEHSRQQAKSQDFEDVVRAAFSDEQAQKWGGGGIGAKDERPRNLHVGDVTLRDVPAHERRQTRHEGRRDDRAEYAVLGNEQEVESHRDRRIGETDEEVHPDFLDDVDGHREWRSKEGHGEDEEEPLAIGRAHGHLVRVNGQKQQVAHGKPQQTDWCDHEEEQTVVERDELGHPLLCDRGRLGEPREHHRVDRVGNELQHHLGKRVRAIERADHLAWPIESQNEALRGAPVHVIQHVVGSPGQGVAQEPAPWKPGTLTRLPLVAGTSLHQHQDGDHVDEVTDPQDDEHAGNLHPQLE